MVKATHTAAHLCLEPRIAAVTVSMELEPRSAWLTFGTGVETVHIALCCTTVKTANFVTFSESKILVLLPANFETTQSRDSCSSAELWSDCLKAEVLVLPLRFNISKISSQSRGCSTAKLQRQSGVHGVVLVKINLSFCSFRTPSSITEIRQDGKRRHRHHAASSRLSCQAEMNNIRRASVLAVVRWKIVQAQAKADLQGIRARSWYSMKSDAGCIRT